MNRVLEALYKTVKRGTPNTCLHLAMVTYFDSLSLSGISHFFKVQAREELEHAMKIYEYLVDRGQRVELYDVPPVKKNWSSVFEAIRDFYNAEATNTQRI